MKINGRDVKIEESVPLTDILMKEGFESDRIAVELNGKIVSRGRYSDTLISDEDSIEIVRMVGGG